MEIWPQTYTNKEVQRLVAVVEKQQKQIDLLVSEVIELRETKADRRGRKPTVGTTAG